RRRAGRPGHQAGRHQGIPGPGRRGRRARPGRRGPGGGQPDVMTGPRRVPVPEGLDGERLDAALARLFGLSRATAAAPGTSGTARLAGRSAAKWARVRRGEWRKGPLPPPPSPVTAPPPEPVPGLTIVEEDDDIVVVDKPAGVAAHPTPGWTGPTVLGGLLAT